MIHRFAHTSLHLPSSHTTTKPAAAFMPEEEFCRQLLANSILFMRDAMLHISRSFLSNRWWCWACLRGYEGRLEHITIFLKSYLEYRCCRLLSLDPATSNTAPISSKSSVVLSSIRRLLFVTRSSPVQLLVSLVVNPNWAKLLSRANSSRRTLIADTIKSTQREERW